MHNLLFKALPLLVFSSCSFLGLSSDETDKDSSDEIIFEDEEEKGFGSDFTEIELYSEGIRSFDAERYSISKKMFQKLVTKYPSSPLNVIAELKIADSIFYSESYLESVPYYKEFLNVHSTHEARPYVLYQIAQAYRYSFKGVGTDTTPLKESKKIYNRILEEHPYSPWAKYAQDRLQDCDSELLLSEVEVIKFYDKKGQDKAARSRLKSIESNYSHLSDTKNILNKVDIPIEDTDADPSIEKIEEVKESADINKVNKTEIKNKEMEVEEVKDNFIFNAPHTRLVNIKPDNEKISNSFLSSYSCDSNEEISRIILYFNQTPYYSHIEQDDNFKNETKNESELVIKNSNSLDVNLNAISKNDNWLTKTEEACGSSLDKIQISEYAHVKDLGDHAIEELDKVILRVTLDSQTERKLHTLLLSSPDRLILTYR